MLAGTPVKGMTNKKTFSNFTEFDLIWNSKWPFMDGFKGFPFFILCFWMIIVVPLWCKLRKLEKGFGGRSWRILNQDWHYFSHDKYYSLYIKTTQTYYLSSVIYCYLHNTFSLKTASTKSKTWRLSSNNNELIAIEIIAQSVTTTGQVILITVSHTDLLCCLA